MSDKVLDSINEITIQIKVDIHHRRILLDFGYWAEMDLEKCAHGEKLRWSCDDCETWFEKNIDKVNDE